jgi:hypothetical protein
LAGGSLDGAGGINMLGATLWAGVRMGLSVPLSGGAWDYLFAMMASVAYLMTISYAQPGGQNGARPRIGWTFTLYLLCLAGMAPLFALALDWGRWIAGINVSMVIILCAGEFNEPLPVTAIAVSPTWVSRLPAPVLLSLAAVFGLTFNLPEAIPLINGRPYKFFTLSAATTPSAAPLAFSSSSRLGGDIE